MNRSENSASDDFTLQPSEPYFDLIQPGRIGRREVQRDISVMLQELVYVGRFMRRQIVEDDVNLLARLASSDHLIQEDHDLGAGVPRGRFALHLAGFHV